MKRKGFWIFWLVVAVALGQGRKSNKEEEEITQTREILKDPPAAVVAETRRLTFHVAPLSAKGLLSQQTRDGLKALLRSTGGIVKIRAFVAGSGDLRRARDIVSETFTERRLPLPALTVVQVGGLPQVSLEAVAVAKKEVNPKGLIFISGQDATSDNPLDPVLPLAEKSLANLRAAVQGGGASAAGVLRVTCFLSAINDAGQIRQKLAAEYPGAALSVVQVQRAPARAVVECEAVARAGAGAAGGIEFLSPQGLTRSPNYSQVVRVDAPKLAFSGSQTAFGFQESDARLAFERLGRELEQHRTSLKDVIMSSIYPLSASLADQVRKVRFEFYDRSRPPASTMLPFDGLPSMDASFSVDVVAVVSR
ncbi:MAG: RidA family protein [Acidobacteria bacterium]|nr:RidA family protein [Acidobacteriota bacterium]